MHEQPEVYYQGTRHNPEDYDRFKEVVRSVIASLRVKASPIVEPDQLEVTLIRITQAILKLDERGVRDPILLQQAAEATVLASGGAPAERRRRATLTLH
jgi:hypothetical protein